MARTPSTLPASPSSYLHLPISSFRLHQLESAHPLWQYYVPLREHLSSAIHTSFPTPPHELTLPIGIKTPRDRYSKTPCIAYSLEAVLAALDALVLYTPEAVVGLRKKQLSGLFVDPPGSRAAEGMLDGKVEGKGDEDIIWERLLQMVHVVHKGINAGMTRAGSAQSSLFNTPKWIEMMEEVRVKGLTEDFMRYSMEVPDDDDDDVEIDEGAGHDSNVVEETTILSSKQSSRTRNPPTNLGFDPYSSTAKAPVPVPALVHGSDFPSSTDVDTDTDTSSEHLDPGDRTERSPSSSALVKARDRQRCTITASSFSPELQVAHIIPFSCGNFSEYYSIHYYWVFLRILLGNITAKATWDFVSGKRINRLENMLCLASHVHSRFGAVAVLLLPVYDDDEPAAEDKSRRGRHRLILQFQALDPECPRPSTFYPKILPRYSFNAVGLGLMDGIPIPNSREELEKHRLTKERTLENGDYVVLFTQDPEGMPLPSWELLAVFANVGRVVWHVKSAEKQRKEQEAEARKEKAGEKKRRRREEESYEVKDTEKNGEDEEDQGRNNGHNEGRNESAKKMSRLVRRTGESGSGSVTTEQKKGGAATDGGRNYQLTDGTGSGLTTTNRKTTTTTTTMTTAPFSLSTNSFNHHPRFAPLPGPAPIHDVDNSPKIGTTTATGSTTDSPCGPNPMRMSPHRISKRRLNLELVNAKLAPYARCQELNLPLRTREEMRWIKEVQRACRFEEDADDDDDGEEDPTQVLMWGEPRGMSEWWNEEEMM